MMDEIASPFQWPELPQDPANFHYEVEMWNCGDEVCECSEPRLIKVYHHETEGGGNWKRPKREQLIEGPFATALIYESDKHEFYFHHAQYMWQVRAARRYNATNQKEAELAAHNHSKFAYVYGKSHKNPLL